MKDGFAPLPDFALRHFHEIDSTNEEAARLARAGAEGPLWLIADRQTKGRGRRGREWLSPTGNLFATLLIRPARPVAQCAQLSFVAALSVADLVGHHVPGADVKVKWPNDVLAEEKKIAGILLESAGTDGARPDWLVLGFGVNLVWHPIYTEFPATSLAELGANPPAARDALGSLAAAWSRWYELWLERGFEPIRDFLACAGREARHAYPCTACKRRSIRRVRGHRRERRTAPARIPAGRLRTISAGEVFF